MLRLTSTYLSRFHVPRHYKCGDNLCGLVYIASGCLCISGVKTLVGDLKLFCTHQFIVRIVPCKYAAGPEDLGPSQSPVDGLARRRADVS
jgi:hypothetical protein